MDPTLGAARDFDYRRFVFGIFLLLFALGTGEEPRGDARARIRITDEILATGRLHLSEPFRQHVQTPDGWTSYFGIGQTLLFLPFQIAGKGFSYAASGVVDSNLAELPVSYLYCPLVGLAYFLALIGMLEAFGLHRLEAARISLAFTFCSVSAYYVTQSFQEETIAGVFVCLSLRAALLWRRSVEKRHAFQTGLFAACILLFRLNAIFVFVPLAALFAQRLHALGFGSVRARQTVVAALLGASGPAAVHAIFSYLRFGYFYSTGYDYVAEHMALATWQPFQFDVAGSLLIGLGKGLLIYSPLLIIALWGMWIGRARWALYAVASLAALAGSVILSASFFAPDGCWSWGPRYQVHLLPLFAYPAWVGIRDLLRRRAGSLVVALAVGLGLLFQLCAMAVPDRVEYTQASIPPLDRLENLLEGCRVVQARQFAMRLGNIGAVLRAVGEGVDVRDKMMYGEFGYFWVLKLARSHFGWVRIAVFVPWLAIFFGAMLCLYPAFRWNRQNPGEENKDLQLFV